MCKNNYRDMGNGIGAVGMMPVTFYSVIHTTPRRAATREFDGNFVDSSSSLRNGIILVRSEPIHNVIGCYGRALSFKVGFVVHAPSFCHGRRYLEPSTLAGFCWSCADGGVLTYEVGTWVIRASKYLI